MCSCGDVNMYRCFFRMKKRDPNWYERRGILKIRRALRDGSLEIDFSAWLWHD